VPDIKRADPETELKVVSDQEKERGQSETGLGMIFGG
jgi:hypothetical protein